MTYFRAIDPYPLQSAQHNKLHAFYEYLADGRFVTTKCVRCAGVSWPPRGLCNQCSSDQFEWVDLPAEGTIAGFSIQESGAPIGFEAPLIFAVVNIGDVRVFARLVETSPRDVVIGARVRPVPLRVTPESGGFDRHVVAFRIAE